MRKDKKNISSKNIANSLRKYRRAKGLKQKEVAEMLGLKSTSMISRWGKGAVLPKTLNLLKLAALYRTMVDGLFIDLLKTVKADVCRREEFLKGKGENDRNSEE